VDRAAERAKAGERRPLAQLAAGDRDAAGKKQPGQPAHADPADADQVNRAQILGCEHVRLHTPTNIILQSSPCH
jgi:hypothetical protein